jgi:hypothetical protein
LILRSLFQALAYLNEFSSIEKIKEITLKTEDEYVFASGITALTDFGNRSILKFLVENKNKFNGLYTKLALLKLNNLIYKIITEKDDEMLLYAIKAFKPFYDGYKVNYKREMKNISYRKLTESLFDLLYETKNEIYIKEILCVLLHKINKNQAKEILLKIPENKIYEYELNFINNIGNGIELKQNKSNIKTKPKESSYLNTKANLETQEYADPGYRDNGFTWAGILDWIGHTGLCAGMDSGHNLRIIEVGGTSEVVKHNYWSSMQDNPDGLTYWGAHTINASLSGYDMTFSRRHNVMNTAVYLIGRDIGYPVFPTVDALRHNSTYTNIYPNEIDHLRCDGLVEYCYEFNGYWVWGKNGQEQNFDISQVSNVDDHNYFWDEWGDDPNEELAPIVQSGYAGGTSTRMNWQAQVDYPTYEASYVPEGSNVQITITAEDKSGIHYIGYKIGSNSWQYSPAQDQHPDNSSYTFQFDVNLSSSETIYYFAMDNGHNFPQDAESVNVVYSPTLETPSNGSSTTDATPYFNWSSVTYATGYDIDIDGNVYSTTSSSYTPSSNLSISSHSWKVRAKNSTGNSSYTSSWSVTVQNPIPGTPTLASPTNGSSTTDATPYFNWNNVTYATGYDIDIDGSVNSTTSSSYTPSGNLSLGSHNWKVRAKNSTGNSSYTSSWIVTVQNPIPPTPILAIPANGSSTTDTTPSFDWDDATYATGYDINIDGNVYSVTSSSYTPSGNLSLGSHNWKVLAKNASGSSAYSSNWIVTVQNPIPITPTLIAPTNGMTTTDKTPLFDWNDVTYATGYDIDIDGSVYSITSSSYTPSINLTAGSHSWKVRSKNATGESSYSNIWSLSINTAPVITSFIPVQQELSVYNVAPEVLFEITVYDPDVSDMIYYNWFIENDNQINNSPDFNHTFNENGGYLIKAIVSDGFETDSISWNITSFVGIEELNLPKVTQLHQNYPNPFNPETTISFDLVKQNNVSISVFNYNGEIVRNLMNELKDPGSYTVNWNGKNSKGNTVTTGMYFVVMKTANYSKVIKALMVK